MMDLGQWIASASLSMAVLAAAIFPPHQGNDQQARANAAEMERVLVTCGNRQGDLRHPETTFCLQWWATAQGRQGPASMCSECIGACQGGDYITCRNACQSACGLEPVAEKTLVVEKSR